MTKEEILDKEIVAEDTLDKTTYHFVNTEKAVNVKSKICYKKEDKFTIFPFYIDRETNEPKNKYRKIESITFEGFKEKFPSGFLTKPERGYGVTRYLRPLRKFLYTVFKDFSACMLSLCCYIPCFDQQTSIGSRISS